MNFTKQMLRIFLNHYVMRKILTFFVLYGVPDVSFSDVLFVLLQHGFRIGIPEPEFIEYIKCHIINIIM